MIGTWKTAFGRGAVVFALVGAGIALPAGAQEVLPQTPPGLEDFRLDKPPPREEEPAPKAEQPAPQQQPQPQPQPQPKAQRSGSEAVPTRVQPEADESAPGDSEVTPEPANSTEPLVPPPLVAAAPEQAIEQKSATDAAPPASGWPELSSFWPLLAAAIALLAGFILFRTLRGRAAKDALALAEAPPAPLATAPVRKTAAVPAAPPPARASIEAHFDPGDARLSLANLTIAGTLHLHNVGSKPVANLTMRTAIMSACDGQAALIDAFHADRTQGDHQPLGPMVPGEKMDVKLEMQVPREALQAFDWRDRRFVAPIVLVNIGSDDPAIAPCRLSCVVGQVGKQLSSRLTPIPIDRGPRRFATVQFQPIAA